MYPPLAERKPLDAVLVSLAKALDLTAAVIVRSSGYVDHALFGTQEDIQELARVLKRAYIVYGISKVSDTRYVLIVKHIWRPTPDLEI